MHDFESLFIENHHGYVEAIKQTNDLKKVVPYVNTKGESYSNKMEDILTHVVNHATHHRAQIITDLKSIGSEVPTTDFIFYMREK